MKNWDADREWLKCTMGWVRSDRSSTWPTRGKHGKPQEHYERWYSPNPGEPKTYGRSFQTAIHIARKEAAASAEEIEGDKAHEKRMGR